MSHTLLTCSWCGEVIADEEYQEQAKRVSAELLSEGLMPASQHPSDYLLGEPVVSATPRAPDLNARQYAPSPFVGFLGGCPNSEQVADPAGPQSGPPISRCDPSDEVPDEIGERFGHLEL